MDFGGICRDAAAWSRLRTEQLLLAHRCFWPAEEEAEEGCTPHVSSASEQRASGPWAPGPKLFPPLRALNPLSHIGLMSRKEFFKYVPSSLLFYPLGFLSSDGTTMRHLQCCQTWRRVGSSVHKQRAWCLWQLAEQPSQVSFHFNGSHTSLHVCV